MIDLSKNFSICARRMRASAIRELMKISGQPGIISFAGGYPDSRLFPLKEVADLVPSIFEEFGGKPLQYGRTEGEVLLIEELIKLAKQDGLEITADNIMVTTASQQALDLISKVFIDPSDPVLVELPSYVGGLQVFQCYGAHMVGVPTDKDGVRMDLLSRKLKKLYDEGEHYKFIYLVPDFQNPAGMTLSVERRKKLVDLSDKYDALIVEDTPYRELRYEGICPPTLVSLDGCQNVISIRSFSKILAPALRLGWVIAHPDIIQKLTVAKQSADLCPSTINQYIAAEFCRRGLLKLQIEKLKAAYKRKRDAMLAALKEFMPGESGISWSHPEGGLFLWLVLPSNIDTTKLFRDALKEKVAYVIGTAFYCNGRGHNTLRLNFSYPSEEEIHEGIRRLANVIKAKL